MSAKHMPGPWFVEVNDKSGIAYIRGAMTGDRCRPSDGTGEIANVDLMADGAQDTVMFPRKRADMRANAHLIAAAPDLLAACKALAASLLTDDDAIYEAKQQAKAALLKAEGLQSPEALNG